MTSLVDPTPRVLGSLGAVGPLALGQWRFTTEDVGTAGALVHAALDAGCNLIDTADVYGFDWGGSGFGACEDLLGRVFRRDPALRGRVVLATKGGIEPPTPYNSSRESLTRACEASLHRLQSDVIDLYQIHRPDLFTHPADVAATLSALREAGKIREVGVSNHSPGQTAALAAHLPFPLVSTQPEYSASHLDPLFDGTFDTCMAHALVPLAWSPLAGGRLVTGDGVNAALLATIDRLAEREGSDRAGIALAFALAHPARPVAIVGTQRPERLGESIRMLDVQLDRHDVYDVIQASTGEPLP